MKKQCLRTSCKDVFHSFLFESATYAGEHEIPCVKPADAIPNRLISFSQSISCKDYDQWVHFYEDDFRFERIWNNPRKYLHILKKYKGVILPDFSLYRDMPLGMQIWNIIRSRAIGSWLSKNGVPVIPNVRYGDERTFRICCNGIPQGSIIAIGTKGNIKDRINRKILTDGLPVVVGIIRPRAIIVCGPAPDSIFQQYKAQGVAIVQFDCNSRPHEARNANVLSRTQSCVGSLCPFESAESHANPIKQKRKRTGIRFVSILPTH